MPQRKLLAIQEPFKRYSVDLKVVPAKFLLVCFVCLKGSTFGTRKDGSLFHFESSFRS